MNPVLTIELGTPKRAGSAQSMNPVLIEAMDLLPLLGAQDNAQTPKVRTLCSK